MKVSKTYIHEIEELRHRIVVSMSNGETSSGEWTPLNSVAVHEGEGLFASYGDGNLPSGIFRCKVVPHQVLT